jgi:hypothetical protein
MPLEDSAASVLGPDARMRPVSMSVFPTKGGASAGLTMGQFQALDRQYMQRAEEILTFRDKVAQLKEREAARVQGSQAMRDISALDPSAPDYLTQRNAIISRYPKAVLDDTANKFLDMQEDQFNLSQNSRDYQMRREDEQKSRLDYLAQTARTQEEQRLATEARQRSEDVRRLSASAQRAYNAALGSMPPNEAFVIAQRIHEDEAREVEFLRSGGRMVDLQTPNPIPETGGPPTFRPATERELAERQGAAKRAEREKDLKETRLRDLNDQYDMIQDEIKSERELLKSPDLDLMTSAERDAEIKKINERVAKLQTQAEPLRKEMANLRGAPVSSQGAEEPATSTGGGSGSGGGAPSAITGKPIAPSDFVKPRG